MTTPPRPVPLLIDRLFRLRDHDDISRRTLERIQARAARVFVLDDAAARRVNDTALRVPECLSSWTGGSRIGFPCPGRSPLRR